MTDLPNQSQSVPNQPAPNPLTPTLQPTGTGGIPTPPVVISGSGGKEVEGGLTFAPELPLKPVGHEVVLSKEVSNAGVSLQPQTIPLPPPIASLGVKSVGANVPPNPTSGDTITLPLTDEQIAKALKASVQESVRWLAEWCVRKLKKIHKPAVGKN
jgi:hypothetical protein